MGRRMVYVSYAPIGDCLMWESRKQGVFDMNTRIAVYRLAVTPKDGEREVRYRPSLGRMVAAWVERDKWERVEVQATLLGCSATPVPVFGEPLTTEVM